MLLTNFPKKSKVYASMKKYVFIGIIVILLTATTSTALLARGNEPEDNPVNLPIPKITKTLGKAKIMNEGKLIASIPAEFKGKENDEQSEEEQESEKRLKDRNPLITKAAEKMASRAAKRTEKEEKMVSNIISRSNKFFSNVEEVLNRLDNIFTRVQTRIEKMKMAGKDVSILTPQVTKAKTNRVEAQKAIDTAKLAMNSLQGTTDVQAAVKKFITQMQEVHKTVRTYHKSITDVIRYINASNKDVNPSGTATPSATKAPVSTGSASF